MENYRILERLGKGGQGSVYLAQNKKDGNKYVLKKVECHDESEANKAFYEALALQKLQHPYICGYKEFLVTWDKAESSMFVCIVMTYYPKGDLKQLLQDYQKKKELVREDVVKKYLGEILEALIFIHDKGVIHRDLKPSNIFIKEDGSLVVGDLGVATIMTDTKTCTRCPVGTYNYMAPEVATQPYEEKSDVWSLGCILFELVTTTLFDSPEAVAAKLSEIKADPGVLEEVFEEVARSYSGELISTIRTCLRHNITQRPTAKDLPVRVLYVKRCLESCDSASMEKRKRQQETSSQLKELPSEEEAGLLAVLEHIARSIDHERQVAQGLKLLREMTGGEDGVRLDEKSTRLVAASMRNNLEDRDVQLHGMGVLSNLIITAGPSDVLYTPEIISVIPLAMNSQPFDEQLQQMAASLLMALASDNRASEIAGLLSGIQHLVAAMRTFPGNADLCATCCSALWCLTINENNGRIAADEKAVEEIVNTLRRHLHTAEVVECAAAALIPVCLEDSNFKLVNNLNTVGVVLHAMEVHIKNPKVVKNCCMALAGLVEPDEECAYRVLLNEVKEGENLNGVSVLMRAYELHKDNAEVVETIVVLLMELSAYDDLKAEMCHLGVGPEVLSEVHKRYKENRDIMDPCEKALDNLGAAKKTSK